MEVQLFLAKVGWFKLFHSN